MSDLVVTVPKTFTHPAAPGFKGLAAWIAEGDAAGEPASGQEWMFTTFGPLPHIQPGERVYVVCEGKLRGYAPLVRCMYDSARYRNGQAPIALIRGGGAVAVTIDEEIRGFRGYRTRWWDRAAEKPFPNWRTP
jgi:hypothetical protein